MNTILVEESALFPNRLYFNVGDFDGKCFTIKNEYFLIDVEADFGCLNKILNVFVEKHDSFEETRLNASYLIPLFVNEEFNIKQEILISLFEMRHIHFDDIYFTKHINFSREAFFCFQEQT